LHQQASPGVYRALTALLLLAPGTPMLFQGQEFAAGAPFLYFADHKPELARLVRDGRREFVSQFPSIAQPEVQRRLNAPEDPATFKRCKLDLSERSRHAEAYALHKDLLRLRRDDPAFRAQRSGGVDGAVLGPDAFVLRFFAPANGSAPGEPGTPSNGHENDRLLLINFGADLDLVPAPEPLLAPPAGREWTVLWTSEDPRYGGQGSPPPEDDRGWHLPGRTAIVLAPRDVDEQQGSVRA
jgi:maltooligosyltrehalose trehalohydrolase